MSTDARPIPAADPARSTLQRATPRSAATAVRGQRPERVAVMARVSTPPDQRRAAARQTLASRLDRALVHRLIEFASLAWQGDDADTAREVLQARLLELRIAACGLRTATDAGRQPPC